ncbi:MAG: hypothetical protein HY303_10975 [Candidatus Wallbacteria bacterium]|nr:hypothetical protein [Candidatus Wallbacteria bacterium]
MPRTVRSLLPRRLRVVRSAFVDTIEPLTPKGSRGLIPWWGAGGDAPSRRSRLLALLLALCCCASASAGGRRDNTGSAGTPIRGPENYTEFRQADQQVNWTSLSAFVDRGVGDSRHSRYLAQQFGALFPGTDLTALSWRSIHSLARQCGGAAAPCEQIAPQDVNNEFYLATLQSPNGTKVELTLSSVGNPESLAASGGICRSCTYRTVGATLARVTNDKDPDAPVGFLYFQTTGGRVVYQSFSSSVTLAGGGAAPFTGPTEFDEDTSQSWEADTGLLELPSGAYNVRYAYRWHASDGATGDAKTFSHAFKTPGDASLSLEIEATYTVDVAKTVCSVRGNPPAIVCDTTQVPEVQGPSSVAGGRRLKVKDITPPELTVTLPQGRIDVSEDPKDQPPRKTAHLVTTGRFTPPTDVRVPYDPFETGRYQIEKNRPFAVTLAARDNSGTAQAHWKLELSGGAASTIAEAGGRVEELEANYPIGAVDYRFSATATDTAHNVTIVNSDVEVRDVNAPEIPLRFATPSVYDEDTLYEFLVESDVFLGEAGEAVPAAIAAVARDFTNPTWAGPAEFEKAVLAGEDLAPAVRNGRPFTGRTAEIRSVTRAPGEARVKLSMRLLEPGRQRLELWVRRKFNYEQRIGSSGAIKKTQLYVKARASFDLSPRDITPPGIVLKLVPADSVLPRKGGAELALAEEPKDCEPLPAKKGSIVIRHSPGFSSDLKTSVDSSDGPFPMARIAADKGFRWQAWIGALQRPPAPPAPGSAVVARDFYIPEHVPLSLAAGATIVVTDNLTRQVDVQAEIVAAGAQVTSSSVGSAGFPVPNYLAARTDKDGRAYAAGLAPEAPTYVLSVTATDEAGNQSRLELPITVLDVTPPELDVHLLGQDANGDAVIRTAVDPSVAVDARKVAFTVAGHYLDPSAEPPRSFAFETPVRYPAEDRFYPASGARLPWTFGLYRGSKDNDPSNTDPDFGTTVPEGLRGAFVRQNVRLAARLDVTDNLPGAANSDHAKGTGLTWSVEASDGTTVELDGNGTFLLRTANFPKDKFPGAPEYKFTASSADLAGNRMVVKLPLFVLEMNAEYRRIDWDQKRGKE